MREYPWEQHIPSLPQLVPSHVLHLLHASSWPRPELVEKLIIVPVRMLPKIVNNMVVHLCSSLNANQPPGVSVLSELSMTNNECHIPIIFITLTKAS